MFNRVKNNVINFIKQIFSNKILTILLIINLLLVIILLTLLTFKTFKPKLAKLFLNNNQSLVNNNNYSSPLPPVEGDNIAYYQLRFELSTTGQGARIISQDILNTLSFRIVGISGNPKKRGADLERIWLAQNNAGNLMKISIDYAVDPVIINNPPTYNFQDTKDGQSNVKIYNITNNNQELIDEINKNSETKDFTLDLSKLRNIPPLQKQIVKVQPTKKIFAFYYPWYNENSWQTDPAFDDDQPIIPYNSHDPKAIARQIDQAKSANIDGFVYSWGGPGDQIFPIVLEQAQKKFFSSDLC